jgi:hypothetical protein
MWGRVEMRRKGIYKLGEPIKLALYERQPLKELRVGEYFLVEGSKASETNSYPYKFGEEHGRVFKIVAFPSVMGGVVGVFRLE